VAVATAIILFVVVSIATSGAINDGGLEQAQAQTGTTTSNAITIIGTTSGEIIKIDEDKVDPEICTFAAILSGFPLRLFCVGFSQTIMIHPHC
jgi:hypothetical protein